jgi:hypothetical protein
MNVVSMALIVVAAGEAVFLLLFLAAEVLYGTHRPTLVGFLALLVGAVAVPVTVRIGVVMCWAANTLPTPLLGAATLAGCLAALSALWVMVEMNSIFLSGSPLPTSR